MNITLNKHADSVPINSCILLFDRFANWLFRNDSAE